MLEVVQSSTHLHPAASIHARRVSQIEEVQYAIPLIKAQLKVVFENSIQ